MADAVHRPSTVARILLVEDHPDVRRLLALMLELLGHQVTQAASVAAALAAAGPFDLILCDYGLPDGTAADLLAQLKARGPVKAVMLTAHTKEFTADAAHAGFVRCLEKPVDLGDLEAVVDEALSPLSPLGESLPRGFRGDG